MFVFLVGWIFIHVLTKKSFLITSQVALNDPFIGQKLWGGPASPREELLGSHCCQVDRLALETPLEQPQPRAGPSGPLGPWLRVLMGMSYSWKISLISPCPRQTE